MKQKDIEKQKVNIQPQSQGQEEGQFISIPVYPRAYIQDVTGINSERRTVTAKFVLFVTILIPDELFEPDIAAEVKNKDKTPERKLRNYIREHLILQFGYNQTIFIPEHIVCENNPYLIKRIQQNYLKKDERQEDQKHVTYSIRGSIQCSASFNSMFFPYRKIEVFNHLCFMSQTYDGKSLRYKVMKLKQDMDHKVHQFLPYFGNKHFGDYIIDDDSPLVTIGGDASLMKKFVSPITFLQNLEGVKRHALNLVRLNSIKSENAAKSDTNKTKVQDTQKLKASSKHILFKFDMASLQLSFLLQNEVPIWILSFVTLMLYQAQPSIGGKYSNIILLLVSYISIISNFRISNIEQTGYSFFQLKVIVLTIVPMLLIISTSIDYYSELTFADLGQIQLLTNKFGIASLAVVFFCFLATNLLMLYISSQNLRKKWRRQGVYQGTVSWLWGQADESKTQQQKQELLDWMNMVDLEWVDDIKQ